MQTNPEVCHHGRVKRQCDTCWAHELDREVQDLRQKQRGTMHVTRDLYDLALETLHDAAGEAQHGAAFRVPDWVYPAINAGIELDYDHQRHQEAQSQ